jgi:hypothetical protein
MTWNTGRLRVWWAAHDGSEGCVFLIYFALQYIGSTIRFGLGQLLSLCQEAASVPNASNLPWIGAY